MQNNSKSTLSYPDITKRSRSLNKINDSSSILNTCNDVTAVPLRTKFSEPNIANPIRHKGITPVKTFRSDTAQTNQDSPQKISLPISRSQSPFGLPTPSASLKSVQGLSPRKPAGVPDSAVYNSIKAQTMQFFQKTAIETPYYIPISEMQKKQQTTIPDVSIQLSTLRDQLNTTSRCHKLATETSPRRRLVNQPRKVYNVRAMRLKETLMNSANNLAKLSDRKVSKEGSPGRKSNRKNNKEPIKEENTPAQIAAMKKLEEERKFIDSIGKASYDRFYMNIDLYNKYYAAYLQEPEVHYTGLDDLKVSLRPRPKEPEKERAQSQEKEKKKMSIKSKAGHITGIKHFGTFKPTTNVIEIRKTQVIEASKLKFGTERPKREKKAVDWGDFIKTEGEEKTSEEEWLLFGKEMAGVQHNLKILEKMNGMIENKGELTDEEHRFFKAVKEGKEAEVDKMLRMNSDLVKIRDIGNKTPLHWAMKRHYLNIIGELYSYGAELDDVDMAGRKPLDLVDGHHKKEILGILEQKHWRLRRKTATLGY